mgnify:CR=1 FL=1
MRQNTKMSDPADHQIFPKKRYGQNFLQDHNIINNIIELSGGLKDKDVLEIGGGTGNLTRQIIKENPKKLIVVEVDNDLVAKLRELEHLNQQNVKIVCGDILEFNIMKHFEQPPIIVGNLPYNISTKILTNLLMSSPPAWTQLILMFQMEVAERIIAKPNSKKFGRLSVLAQYCSIPSIKIKISNKVFFPTPKVKSAVVVFNRKKNFKEEISSDLFFFIVKKCFSQRRKKIINTLKDFYPEISLTLEECNIDPGSRAENLSIEDYYRLTEIIQRKR